jgi:hypothetical protein
MNRTYSEQRQAILFRAARDLRGVAGQVLDDVTNPVELTSATTPAWAKSVARKTAEMANDLERQGHEQGPATTRQENELARSRQIYSVTIDAFEKRIRAAGGTVPTVGRFDANA